MALDSYRCNYLSELEEEIALEGLDGITVEALWVRLLDRPFCSIPPNTDQTKAFLWEAVSRMENVRFYRLPTQRPPIFIFKRAEEVDELGNYIELIVDYYDWCTSNVRQNAMSLLYADFIAKLDLDKFGENEELKETHLNFLRNVVDVCTLYMKNLLKLCSVVAVKEKGVVALYEFYKRRRDKMSGVVFEMFHPIIENTVSFVLAFSPENANKFREARRRLESFYIVCWDTCEYLEFCMRELEVIHSQSQLRPMVPSSVRCLHVLKMLLTLSVYWKSNHRFLDILIRLHMVIQSKVKGVLCAEHLFTIPNRIAVALCRDVIYVTTQWQGAVERDRDFSQKINFSELAHLRDVAQSILDILRVMKSYKKVYCRQCYDAENDNYKLDAIVEEVSELTLPLLSPDFDYLDVDYKHQWDELVSDFHARCSAFDKEASLLIVDAINKTKSTRSIASILIHFRTTTRTFKMDSLFEEIFGQLDISPQFSNEIRQVLEIFLKTSYYKDSMKSFGLATKNLQWTRCLFYVVQKNLRYLASIGTILPRVFEKVIINYFRCVDIFVSYEIALYKVWLKRFVNYTHKVLSRKLVQLAYLKQEPVDNECEKFLDSELMVVRFPIAAWNPESDYAAPNGPNKIISQFGPLVEGLREEQIEQLASLHSYSSSSSSTSRTSLDEEHLVYQKNLLVKYGLDLDNWFAERYLLNYNFITQLSLGMVSPNDEQLEANVYFLLEETLRRLMQKDEKLARRLDKLNFIKSYDCQSSSGSITKVSELLTEESWSDGSEDKGIVAEANHFIVERNPGILKTLTSLSYFTQEELPLFISIRDKFKEKVFDIMGGNPTHLKELFAKKTAEVLEVEDESSCSEDFDFPGQDSEHQSRKPIRSSDLQNLDKYKVLFHTPVSRIYNYKEMAFVLWLNGTKMKFGQWHYPKKTTRLPRKKTTTFCTCDDSVQCGDCDVDWLNFDQGAAECDGTRTGDDLDAKSEPETYVREVTPVESPVRQRRRRGQLEKYDAPMNDVFVNEEEADSLFRRKFNIYLAKLINESNQPGETIAQKDIGWRISGELGSKNDEMAFQYEVTDDDMPEAAIASQIQAINQDRKKAAKVTRGRYKRELEEAIRQAEIGSSGSEKALLTIDFENELRKAIPGVYTGCKHFLSRMSWSDFIGQDVLGEHGYTIQANLEPFTSVACQDIVALDGFGFALPSSLLAFAYNHFDLNKHSIQEVVTIYRGTVGSYPDDKLMVMKKYVRPIERNICQGLRFCGWRTSSLSKQCSELIVQLNTLAIVEIHMAEVETSIKATLHTIGRLNFYRFPTFKSRSVKDFFAILDENAERTQHRLNKLCKLIPKQLCKMETLLYQQRTGKCEYMISYYRSVEKSLFIKLIHMIKANMTIFRKFVVGGLSSRFYVNLSIYEPVVCVVPTLKAINLHLCHSAEIVVRDQKEIFRWLDGTTAKAPQLRKIQRLKRVHVYNFAEDLMGSVEVVEELQKSYECISFVLDAVDRYARSWEQFEHLWVEDIEDTFQKFALDKPSLQEYFDVFNFYQNIIIDIYRMPDQVDIYCVRIKIKDAKRKTLMYALGWRSFTKSTLSDSILVEGQTLFSKMQNAYFNMAGCVTSCQSLKQVLRSCYFFNTLELEADMVVNMIAAKDHLAKYWLPPHLFVESSLRNVVISNMKQLKHLSLYRPILLEPYLSKIVPRAECIQCSLTRGLPNETATTERFGKFLSVALKDRVFGATALTTVTKLLERVSSTKESCPWNVVDIVLDHLRTSVQVIDWFSLLHPKLVLTKLLKTKELLELLGFQRPTEKSEQSLDSLLKSLK